MADYIPGALSRVMVDTANRIHGVDEMRTAAELAARQFDSIPSPNAQFWASQLREDPRGAFTMAQQYGGVAAVEQALQGAYARGAAVRSASPQEMNAVLFERSPQDWALMQQGNLAGAKARSLTAPPPPSTFDTEYAKKLRADYTKRSSNFETIRHFYEIAVANAAEAARDPDNPGSVDFSLVQAYGKMLDPNSVVRNEEGKFIAESQSSTVQDALNRFARLFSAAGTLNPQARLNLMRQIQATYNKAAERQDSLLQEIGGELDRLGATGIDREFAMPIGIQLSADSLDLAPWEAMARSAPGGTTPKLKVGSFVDTPQGRLKVVGFDDDGEPLVE